MGFGVFDLFIILCYVLIPQILYSFCLKAGVLLLGTFPFSLPAKYINLCSCQAALNTAIQLSSVTGLLSQGIELDFLA